MLINNIPSVDIINFSSLTNRITSWDIIKADKLYLIKKDPRKISSDLALSVYTKLVINMIVSCERLIAKDSYKFGICIDHNYREL